MKRLIGGLISTALDRLELSRGDLNRNDRRGAFNRAWGFVFTNQIVGDYYEFGVYRGDGLVASYRAYQSLLAWLDGQTRSAEAWRREVAAEYRSRHPLRFIGLDTFAGMPNNNEQNPTFKAGTFVGSESEVATLCSASGLVPPQLELVPGLFADTAQRVHGMRPAAIVNVDGDLYESAVDALAAATPLIQQGTVLLCDDYNAFRARRDAGERRALAEWSDRSGIVAEPWFAYQFAGQAFLCQVQQGSPAAGAATRVLPSADRRA